MEEDVMYWMSLPEEELLKMLVPPDERHSPDSDLPRGKYIFKQCIKRSKNALELFNHDSNDACAFTSEMVMALIPLLSESVPSAIVGIIAVLVLKYGIKNFV